MRNDKTIKSATTLKCNASYYDVLPHTSSGWHFSAACSKPNSKKMALLRCLQQAKLREVSECGKLCCYSPAGTHGCLEGTIQASSRPSAVREPLNLNLVMSYYDE
eukprot:165368-Amphidinium_carterae.1